MKKLTKLLSVLLAFVMALSCMTMMASAAKTKYQTVADLEALSAYSPYGTVTRLTTEERMSILFDFLDLTLAPMSSLNMGQVVNAAGLKLTINLTSVDNIFATIDDVCDLKASSTYKFAALFVDLGIVEDLNIKENTHWTKGMRRDTSAQMAMVNNLLKLLKSNASVFGGVFDKGLELGLIANFIPGLNLKPINNLITNLPDAIKGIVFPLFSRQDDTSAERNKYSTKSNDLVAVAQDFVYGLFTKPMNWTSYRVDETGKDLGYTLALPTEADGTTRYFRVNEDGTKITQFDYKYAGLLGDPAAGYVESVTYTKAKEFDTAECKTYVFKAPAGYEGDQTLKWYKADNFIEPSTGRVQSSYWLPSVKKAIESGALTLEINGADSVLGLIYKFIPYVFAEMAPVVLNGSAKKLMAEAFDVVFTEIGVKGDASLPNDPFFTAPQEFYVWEYSDYKVIDGVPYYRFQDQFFKGEIPSNISVFYSMINWNYEITGDFFNEFIPTTVGSTWALDSLNNIIAKAIKSMIAETWTVKGTTYNRSTVFPWATGDNSKLLNNLMVCARNFFNIAPEEIVDEYVEEAQFYNAMMNGTLKQAVNGLLCELIKLIMPQIVFADNIVDQPITAVAAIVVRELCTQLMPSYNFDAMIYANYGDASNAKRELLNKSADYWLDTTLYMGVNLGMFYLRNITDIGEDAADGYFNVMSDLGAIPTITTGKNTPAAGNAMTFSATSQYVGSTPSWLYQIDWIVDWALTTTAEFGWHFERLLDCGTVDLATYQNPFNKIDTVLLKLLPLDQLLNVSEFSGSTYGSGTFLEKVLKDGLVDSIVNLDVVRLLKLTKIPDGYFRQGNIADNIVKIVVNLLDNVFYKVSGNTDLISKTSVTSVATLLNQTNIKNFVVNLLGKLQAASETYNVLDPIMPILGFFVGWTTDAQKYAEPNIYFTNDWGSSYLYTAADGSSTNNPQIKITNKSSGMLLKHRNSSVTDTAYSIKITNVELDGGVTYTASFPITVQPGDTAEIALSIPSTSGTTRATITYEFTGKDDQPLGGTQKKIAYAYISDVTDQMNETVAAVDTGDYWQRGDYKSYEFTTDVYKTVTEYQGAGSYKAAAMQVGNKTKNFVSVKYDTVPGAPMSDYFDLITDRATAGWVPALIKDQVTQTSGYFWAPKSGVTSETVFPYGVYDGGQIAVKYGNKSGTWVIDFIYYNDFDINDIKDKYVGYALTADQFSDAAAFATYETALRKVVELADVAKRIDYVDVIQPQIEGAIKALEDAYKALTAGSSSSYGIGDIAIVENALAAVETNPARDLNFQDHDLFEYFQYEKQRNAARAMINSTKGPEAPTKHIENEGASAALIDAIVAAQANANVKTGINATVIEPTQEDLDAYAAALADFKPATYSELQVDDQASKINYYADFMKACSKSADKTFLDKEITYAEAQKYDSSLYSADSWSRYQDALAEAKRVSADSKALESTTFDAKYELMVAQNKLQRKDRSMKEVGYMNEELIPLIAHANAVLDNYGTIYAVKAGITEADALGQLVKALGIAYNEEIDGVKYEGILYSRSALTFQKYDRTATAKNKRAVDAAADKLRAAIENFESTAKLEAKDETTAVDQSVRFIQGIVPGSIANAEQLLARVTVTGGNAVTSASKAGNYGTGARIEIKSGDILLATYFVVIYGDVNGDGAVDAFDAIEVDVANCTAHYMGDVYDDAADLTNDGKIDAADYAALVTGVKCDAAISQNPNA